MSPFIVTFYSYKGGVGRTLLAANVAVLLAHRGKTLLWDLDIEAPGLHRIPDLRPQKQPASGFFEWLLTWQGSDGAPEGAAYPALRGCVRSARVATDLSILQAHGEKADFADLYQSIRWDEFLVRDPARGLALFRGALAAFGQDGYRYVVLDARTGITDMGGLLTGILPHATVLVGNYGAQNTGGLAHVWRALARAADGRIAARDPLPPLHRLLVGSPIPQGQVELAAEGRRVWQQAFEGLPTQMVEVPFDERLLFSESLLAARGEDSPVTRAYRAITDALTEIESDLRAAAEAPTKHPDAVDGREPIGPTRKERGERFEDRMAGLLSLLGYAVEREQLVGSNQVDLVVRSRVGLIDQLFLVECKDHKGEIYKAALEVFQTWVVQARREHPSAQGMFIARRFAPAAVTYAKEQDLHLFTPADLEARLFDFVPYLRRRAAEYEGSPIFGRYVRQNMLPETDNESVDLLDHAQRWAEGHGSRLWLLLGDYGTGKSSFVRQLAYQLAKAALEDETQSVPIPVFIDLKDVPNAVSLDSLLLEHFRRYLANEFSRFNPASIRYLMDTGRVVLLLDSFDEMGLAQAGRSMDEQFRELAQHAREGVGARSNRILITCRSHFFRSQQQVKDVVRGPGDPLLPLEHADTPLGQVARGFGASIAELLMFEESQVAEFLRLQLGAARAAEVLGFIHKTYDLQSLARRPVMLDMIMKSADRLKEIDIPVTAGLLYSVYTGNWLRDRSSRQLQTGFEQRLALLEMLAHAMWIAPDNQIHHLELPGLLRQRERLFAGVDAARVDLELRTASFLVRDAAGYYRFSHKSFHEYFYARHLVSAVTDGRNTDGTDAILEALNGPPVTPQYAGFCADLLTLPGSETDAVSAKVQTARLETLARVCREVLGSAYRPRISENLLLLVHHMGRHGDDAQSPGPRTRGTKVPIGTREDGGGHGGPPLRSALETAIPEGAQLAGAQLAGQDLSRVRLRAADLAGADLSGTAAVHADVRRASLRGADLRHAGWVEALADEADLTEIDGYALMLNGAWLNRADLTGARLATAELQGAKLEGARLHATDLRFADLSEIEAKAASFDRADLTAARLIGAECSEASFKGTAVYAARLKDIRLDGADWSPASDAYMTAPRDPANWTGREAEHLEPRLPEATQRLPPNLRAILALGHSDSVRSVTYSPDSKRIASGSGDCTVKLWDAASGACLMTLEGHGNSVTSVAYSPDGKRIASGSWDCTVKLWDAASGACLTTLEGHGNGVTSVAYSPDGKRIASGSEDHTVKLWNAASGACLTTLEGHGKSVSSVAYSPDDGTRIASGSWDCTVKLWDAASGACLTTLEGHGNGVSSVAYSPDGKRIASGSEDHTVKLWNAASGTFLTTLEGHGTSVLSVAYSPDGKRIASGSWDDTVKLWDAASGACLTTLEGHGQSVSSVTFSRDGKRIASGSEDHTVKLWNAASGTFLTTLEGHGSSLLSVAYSRERIASGSWDDTVKLWDAASGACLTTLEGHGQSVSSVMFSRDGKRLASGSRDGTVKLWDAARGACLTTFEGHGSSVLSVAYSPDGKRLASGSWDNTVKLWDAASGACLTTLEGHGQSVTSVMFSRDGKRLASGSRDGTVKLWDAASGACLATLEGHGQSVTSVAYSPDGQRIASGSRDGTVKLWDAASGACLATLEGHGQSVWSVAYSPDGQRIASGSRDRTVKLWDAASGACLMTLEGHGNRVLSVAYSPDGQRIASGSRDRTVKLWDAASGACLATLVTTPAGWLTLFADQRFRSRAGAETYLRYIDAAEAGAIPIRIWHAEDIAFRMRVPEGEVLAPLIPSASPTAKSTKRARNPPPRKR